MLRKVLLFWYSFRYIKTYQILTRFLIIAHKCFLPLQRGRQVSESYCRSFCRKTDWQHYDAWNCLKEITVGRFTFLEETTELGRPVRWSEDKQTLLWRFWLHAFNYLHLISREEKMKLCHDWIGANPIGSQPAWHPYPLSRRIINWCKIDLQDSEIASSLYQQTDYLHRNLETYLGGNHLLENARALVLAGCYFDGDHNAVKWLQRGLSLFEKETEKQILHDGWHFERSPMYHALMLEGYLDVLNLLSDDHGLSKLVVSTVCRMIDALVSATRPDGQITLFNDATEEIAPSTAKLVEYGRSVLGYDPQPRESFPDAGYYTYRDNDLFIFIDGGAIGPDHLPAHAHADIFSYELCLRGLPFVVDTGVYEYQAGEMRDHVRHTRAHNTVCVDGVSQAECWKSFRVARRYPPKDVSYEIVGGTRVFHGRFNGYAHLIGDRICHERTIIVDPVHRLLTVDDAIHGHGTHTVESLIHLHPNVTVRNVGSMMQLELYKIAAKIEAVGANIQLASGWYCPRMGVRHANPVIVLKRSGQLPLRIGYKLSY